MWTYLLHQIKTHSNASETVKEGGSGERLHRKTGFNIKILVIVGNFGTFVCNLKG